MKKVVIITLVFTAGVQIVSCKAKDKQTSETVQTAEVKPATPVDNPQPANQPKTYTITATPDSAVLGKKSEALLKIKDIKAIELSDPEGKSKGYEMTYKIEMTNKNAIGGNTLSFSSENFRVELDNGQKVAPDGSIYLRAAPEETTLSDEGKFVINLQAKPVALHLFYDDTKAQVKLEMK